MPRMVLALVGKPRDDAEGRRGQVESSHVPLDEAQIRHRRRAATRISRWRRRPGAPMARLLLFGAGGGLLVIVYGWYVAKRIAQAWCFGCG